MIPYPFKSFPGPRDLSRRKTFFFDGIAQIKRMDDEWRGAERWVLWDFKACRQDDERRRVSADSASDEFFNRLQEWLSHEPRASEISNLLKGQGA